MTEAEWLVCEDPTPMLAALTPETCLRKSRLFMVACCRRHFGKVVEQECKEAIEAAERFADGSEQLQTLIRLRERLPPADPDSYAIPLAFPAAAYWITHGEDTQGNQVRCLMEQVVLLMQDVGGRGEQAAQAALLLDIFGNPFSPPASLVPSLRTRAALSLAQAAYDARLLPSGFLDPARLAVLSDALEDAGCTDATILSHLRSPGPHVRGCWALDLILGKS
jgi:hypothetical protein